MLLTTQFQVMNSSRLYLFIIILAITACGGISNKKQFERSGVIIQFGITQLGELEQNDFKKFKEIYGKGEFILIEKHNSIVIRHDDGGDELLKINNIDKDQNGIYEISCDKERGITINPSLGYIDYYVGDKSFIIRLHIVPHNKTLLKESLFDFWSKNSLDSSELLIKEYKYLEKQNMELIKKNEELQNKVRQLKEIRSNTQSKFLRNEYAEECVKDYFDFYKADYKYRNIKVRKVSNSNFHIAIEISQKYRDWYHAYYLLVINSDGSYSIEQKSFNTSK